MDTKTIMLIYSILAAKHGVKNDLTINEITLIGFS
jgi:hypothetical protein